MPAPIDLTGAVLGKLRVVAAGRPAGCDRKVWIVRCECGREQAYPQRRLTQSTAGRPAVRECSACAAPACIVCGQRLRSRSTTRRTCDACRLVHKRAIANAYWHRRVASGAVRPKTPRNPDAARRSDAEAYQRRLERERADPIKAEARKARARERYREHARAIQARRREAMAKLDPEAFAALADRMRAYQRQYARRRREGIASDPAAHRVYLDYLAERRRRHALAEFAAEGATLKDRP